MSCFHISNKRLLGSEPIVLIQVYIYQNKQYKSMNISDSNQNIQTIKK